MIRRLIILLLIVGCEDDDNDPRVGLSYGDDNYRINVFHFDSNETIFAIEFLKDLSHELGGEHPNRDYVAINIDINQNGIVDSLIDITYIAIDEHPNISDGLSFCKSYLIDYFQTTQSQGCLESDATAGYLFDSSPHQTNYHPMFSFTIPNDEIYLNGSVYFTIETFSKGYGFTIYPLDNEYANDNVGFVAFNKVLKYP